MLLLVTSPFVGVRLRLLFMVPGLNNTSKSQQRQWQTEETDLPTASSRRGSLVNRRTYKWRQGWDEQEFGKLRTGVVAVS